MTTLATPAPTSTGRSSGAPSLVRWLLRLHRPALLVWVALVIVVGALLLWVGGPLTDASAEGWKQYNACKSVFTCPHDTESIGRYKDWYNYATFAVLAVPFLAAAWSGASLIGREMENGTAHLVWAQSVTPARWLATKLAVPAVLVTAGSGLLVGLHHWAWSNGQGRISTAQPWYADGTYAANGTIVVALALAGLAAGALIGVYRRDSLGSLIGSVSATGFLWGAVTLAMPNLWPAVTRITSLKHDHALGTGPTLSEGLVTSTGARITDPYCGPITDSDCRAVYTKLDAVSYYKVYHPESHYWPLQLTATAIILAVTAALTVAAFQLLKHRTGSAPARKETSA
ncbi:MULTISPECIES: ABC transporter permease [unclassified Streptomyces]|uniref:ABC transporter permease n=1 Tax=unclassified Streptomyces TaxID=2593676 RepID=UPI002E8061D6|nr:ABC transporter permease [Streptomyces sp. NBC_00589]WTI38140.1 ABC transporter permease [Streptomyces sp. NBC_00775]WUB28181.1 ABC transporter permease [Streptomyces sp. NBC_00589]